MEWFEDFFGKWVVKKRWWIIAATIIIAAVAASGIDLGFIGEWAYDERDDKATTASDNDLMAGVRLALNDAESTEDIMAITQDMDSDGTSLSLESNRRISDHWKISLDAFFVLDSSEEDIIHPLRDDDSMQIELSYYF